jgi:PAS domain S-box-containing protein
VVGVLLTAICRLTAALIETRAGAASSTATTRSIVNATTEGVVLLSEEGKIESLNGAAESMFGYAAAEVVGKDLNQLLPSLNGWSATETTADHFPHGVTCEPAHRSERNGKRKDGSTFRVEVGLGQVRSADGKRFTAVLKDLSGRSQAEEARVRSERFLQKVIDELPEPLMVVGRDHEIILANRAVRNAVGGRDPVSEGLACYQASHHQEQPCTDASHPCPLREVISTRKPTAVTHTHLDAEGNELLMEIIAAPILDGAGEVIQVIESCRDITARVRAEDDARQRQAEMAHVARLATMGEMAGGMAHELNQPLFAIVNYLQACQERIRAGAADADGLLEDLSQAAAQAERAGNVIEHIRMFLRKEKLLRAEVDLNRLVKDAVSLMETEVRRNGATLRLALADSLPNIRVVPLQVEQVVVNLIQNGLDAMKETKVDERLLVISTGTGRNRDVEFSIEDRGSGLPDGEAERMFDPFFTTKSNGMGMGLSIARSIVETHGGRLWATPGQDVGATFRFSLPASNGDVDNGK